MAASMVGTPGAGAPPRGAGRGAWGLVAAMAALSATGAPTPKVMAQLTGAGLDPGLAAALLHVGPVVLTAVMLPVIGWLSRGRGPLTRLAAQAGGGMIVGFVLAMCLDLFVGVLPAIERLTGPLRETNGIDIAAWALCAFSLLNGAMMGALALFGAPALRAIALDTSDPDCMDVRARERPKYGLSALGFAGQGLFVGALAVAHQLGAEAPMATRLAIVAAVALGVAGFLWSSLALWRGFDEMLRRITVEAYAWSGLVAWIGAIVWAVLESLSLAPPLTAYASIIALVGLQTLAAYAVTMMSMLPGKAGRA